MSIKLISELRAQSGQGLKDCKAMIEAAMESLSENATDQEIVSKAFDLLQKNSGSKVEKKAGRTANQGLILTGSSDHYALILELNCETDFVARNDSFKDFANQLLELALTHKPLTQAEFLVVPTDNGLNVGEAVNSMIATIGENIKVGNFVGKTSSSELTSYNHGGKLAVLVEFTGDADSAKDVALHIAANNPVAIDEASICQDLLSKERSLYLDQAKDSGKPEEVQNKMVEGRLKKFLAEVTLLGQNFVKDDEITVAEYLNKTATSILSFQRVALGEVASNEA